MDSKKFPNVVAKLNSIISKIKRGRVTTIDVVLDLIDEFGHVAIQALDALEEGRAYKIRFGRAYNVSFFVGNRDYYIILPETGYCGCISKYAVGAVERSLCYHFIAFKLMESLGIVKELSFEKRDFRWVIDELKYKKIDMDI